MADVPPPDLFSERQRATLRALCDALIPAAEPPDGASDQGGLYGRAAHDLHVAEAVEAAIQQATDKASQRQIALFLTGLDQGAVNGLLDGPFKAFVAMTRAEQERVLLRWSTSRIAARRKAFQAIKRLAMFMFYALVDGTGHNPNWATIGYSGPPPRAPEAPRPIQPLRFTGDTTLDADVVIIGSGAGGGVVAGELSAAGLSVIVIEKGGYNAEPDYDGLELATNQRMYENQGLCTSADLSMLILAGATLGGGTVVNWNVSLQPPDDVLHEWEDQYKVPGFTGAAFQQSIDAVCARINVNTAESAPNGQNAVLERGGKALGLPVQTLARNVRGCEDCGFCNMGCSFGAKQSTLATYLQDAYDRGARIIVDAHAERVLQVNGRATGVACTARDATGRRVQLTVHAKAVVAAGGALQTPALLLRSGLKNPHIGANLHLHPVSVTYGVYDHPVEGWRGAPMTRIITEYANLDHSRFGFILESAPIHPGIAALTLPWHDGASHKQVMAGLRYLGNIIAIARDEDGGRVTINRKGAPIYHYTLSGRDTAKIARGVREALRIHEAAGALEVSAPHTPPHTLRFRAAGTDQRKAQLGTFLTQTDQRGYARNTFALFSAHQMSSARMGGDPTIGACDPTGESFEVRGLYVADGSALPSAVGRNPMITIMSVAHTIAGHIAARLR